MKSKYSLFYKTFHKAKERDLILSVSTLRPNHIFHPPPPPHTHTHTLSGHCWPFVRSLASTLRDLLGREVGHFFQFTQQHRILYQYSFQPRSHGLGETLGTRLYSFRNSCLFYIIFLKSKMWPTHLLNL